MTPPQMYILISFEQLVVKTVHILKQCVLSLFYYMD